MLDQHSHEALKQLTDEQLEAKLDTAIDAPTHRGRVEAEINRRNIARISTATEAMARSSTTVETLTDRIAKLTIALFVLALLQVVVACAQVWLALSSARGF